MPKSRVLVIDDEAAIRDSLKMTLEYEGYEFLGHWSCVFEELVTAVKFQVIDDVNQEHCHFAFIRGATVQVRIVI